MNLFIQTLVENPEFYITWICVVAFSICIHEYSHAATAYRRGDDTAALSGHLTLNPMVQMGVSSLVMLALIGIAWGAVPVNESRLRSARDRLLVSAAGPLANLGLCILFALALSLISLLDGDIKVVALLARICWIGAATNGVLFILNSLPIPSLDGWNMLSCYIPKMKEVSFRYGQHMMLIALVIIFITPVGDLIWDGGFVLAGWLHQQWSLLISAVV